MNSRPEGSRESGFRRLSHVIGPDMRHGGKGQPRIIIEIQETT